MPDQEGEGREGEAEKGAEGGQRGDKYVAGSPRMHMSAPRCRLGGLMWSDKPLGGRYKKRQVRSGGEVWKVAEIKSETGGWLAGYMRVFGVCMVGVKKKRDESERKEMDEIWFKNGWPY